MSFQDNVTDEIQTLAQIQTVLDPLLQGTLDQFIENTKDQESITSLSLSLAYTFSSLYYVYLKLNGIETKNAPIMKEIQRVKQNYERLTTIKNKQNLTIEPKPYKKINIEVLNRFVRHGTNNQQSEEQSIQYEHKQATLITEEHDFSQRMATDEVEQHSKANNQKKDLKDLWADTDDAKGKVKQQFKKGALIPRQGHLNWKKEIEKLMK